LINRETEVIETLARRATSDNVTREETFTIFTCPH